MQLKNINKSFGAIEVLEDITLSINKEEIVCILGPSGCGKSTLLNILSGLIEPDTGDVQHEIKKMGYVFQEDRLLPWKTVYENIRFVEPKSSKEEIYRLIADIGLEGFEHYFPSELSGGMKQRCSIARAFNYHSDLLLMDEPFKSLDYTLRLKMLKQLISLWEKTHNSILFITHEIDEALLLGDRIIILSDRPARIIKVFKIGEKQTNRQLDSGQLIKIRSEIINLLSTPKNKGVV